MLPLYLRARESQRSDAIIKDEKSIEAVRQLTYDFT
jgi:O-methyltransferase involved in polyketide biosynthesis